MISKNKDISIIKQEILDELKDMHKWLQQAKVDYETSRKLKGKEFVRKKIENLQQASEKLHKKSVKIIPIGILLPFIFRTELFERYPGLYSEIEKMLKKPEREMRYKQFSAHLPQLWTIESTNKILGLAKEGMLTDFLEYLIGLIEELTSKQHDKNMLFTKYPFNEREFLSKIINTFPNIKKFYQEMPMVEIQHPKYGRKEVEQELLRLEAIKECFKPTRYLIKNWRGRLRLKIALLIMNNNQLLKIEQIARTSLFFSYLIGIFLMFYCISLTLCINNILGPFYSLVRYPEDEQIEDVLVNCLPDIEEAVKESLMAFEFGLKLFSIVDKLTILNC